MDSSNRTVLCRWLCSFAPTGQWGVARRRSACSHCNAARPTGLARLCPRALSSTERLGVQPATKKRARDCDMYAMLRDTPSGSSLARIWRNNARVYGVGPNLSSVRWPGVERAWPTSTKYELSSTTVPPSSTNSGPTSTDTVQNRRTDMAQNMFGSLCIFWLVCASAPDRARPRPGSGRSPTSAGVLRESRAASNSASSRVRIEAFYLDHTSSSSSSYCSAC